VNALHRLPALHEHRAAIEEELRRAVLGEDPFLTEVASHLLSAGGQRWRPLLCVASALAGGGEVTAPVIRGACSVELVHLGSLYHDDVIDEAPTRRTVESVNARWGNLTAIVAGDFLLARASEIAASLGTEVAGLLAATIGRLCEGEIRELRSAFDTTRSEEAYLASVAGKTASLLAASSRIGGLVAGLGRPVVEAVTRFGEAFGVVFQIVDDVKDLVLSEADLGKPVGHDLVEGVYTLPVIRALALDDGDELAALLGRPIDAPALEKARAIVVSTGGIESSLQTAREWADLAAAYLAPLGGNDAAAALARLGYGLIDQLSGL
jgi:heptaprenyl diphosphate synthase